MNITLGEQYCTHKHLLALGGFKDDKAIQYFMMKNGIEKDPRGYPVFKIMKALNSLSTMKQKDLGLSEELLRQKVRKEQVATDIKLKIYIPRQMAIDRIRTTLQAVANKIRYAIKLSSPRVIGIMAVNDIEGILTEQYNSAMEQLEVEAESIQSWEDYGYTNLQQTGETVASDTEEDSSYGSSEENSGIGEDQRTREDRPPINTILD